MAILTGILWLALCGVWMAAIWFVLGILYSITYIGLPVGLQCFKMAKLALSPFGKEPYSVAGAGSTALNIIWLVFGGALLALISAALGGIMYLTYIGRPFGEQCIKLARLAISPMGVQVFSTGGASWSFNQTRV